MLIRNFTLAASLLAAAGVAAAPVTPEQALARLKTTAIAKSVSHDAPAITLTLSPEMLYIFSSPSGDFIITPSDDRAPALLGYGSDFEPDNIPPAMQYWLETYGAQLSALNEQDSAPSLSPLREAEEDEKEDHASIAPLVKTKWNQGNPYNLLCPSDRGGRAVTGCLATAMAQIINFHKHPIKGTGRHSYAWNNTVLTFDYENTTFEWDRMLNAYDSSSQQIYCNAVATLMRACGIGVNMEYSSSASGASDVYVCSFITEHMGFDQSAAYLMRDWFSAEEWDNMVYTELDEGRPVLYCGQSRQGGHAFVCDGYSQNGLYHINWGWGGTSDGYFRLNALDPYNQGIGGSGDGSGFNTDQSIVTHIEPAYKGSTTFLPFYGYGAFVWVPEYGMFGFHDGRELQGCFNFSGRSYDVTFAIQLEDEKGKFYYAPDEEGMTTVPGADGYQIQGIGGIVPVYPTDLPAGTYKATAVAQPLGSDTWQDCLIPYGMESTVTVRKGVNGTFTYDGSDPDEGNSGITTIQPTEGTVDVYNMQGTRIRRGVSSADATTGLPSGLYIVGGQKTLVR
ncbi:MAG: thiol protease/hemagglutinin PrtT [Muribaculaceae bacterium]|nr:thiol protease/hemagglutinin PrtT [Muribaculaceae bacterium]